MMMRGSVIGLLLLVFAVTPSILYFVLLVPVLVYLVVRFHRRLPVQSLTSVGPLVLMILSGAVFADISAPGEVLKDLWYVSKVIIIAVVGILIGYSAVPSNRWLRAAIHWSGLAAFLEMTQYATGLASAEVTISPLAGVMLLPFFMRGFSSGKNSKTWGDWIAVALILLVVVLSESRTTLILLLLAWLGARGAFQTQPKYLFVFLAIIIVGSIAYQFLPQYNVENITFWGKVQNSLNEILFVTSDDYQKMIVNWRGYEAFSAYQMWVSSSLAEQIFGGGLGTLVDLGFYMQLGENYEVRHIAVLHNTYFAVLVKYGLVGIVLFIYFMTKPFRLSVKQKDPMSLFASNLGKTAAVIFLVTTVVISGPLNKSVLDGITLLWGWSIGMQIQRRQSLRNVGLPMPIFSRTTQATEV